MAEENPFNPHLIVPVGTQVVALAEVKGRAGDRVCPRGSVGEILTAPHDNFHPYYVRFPDGTEAALRRHEFAVRSHHQAGQLLRPEDGLSDLNLSVVNAMKATAEDYGDDRYFTRLAAAYVRGRLGAAAARGLSPAELIGAGLAAGLRLHKFKRNAELPRVRRVIGILRGLAPATLLDVGSGRGTFLWPLLDAFPDLQVTAIDTDPRRVADLEAVSEGGVRNLRTRRMDAAELKLEDQHVEVVTALEVLEHLPSPRAAAAEAVRVASGYVIASVPSKEDENPEHIQFFDRRGFESLFLEAGAKGVKVDFVLNHMIAVAKV